MQNDTARTEIAVTIGASKHDLEACRGICDFEDTRASTRTDVVIIDLNEHQYHLDNNPEYQSSPEAEAVLATAKEHNPNARYVIVWNTG